MLKRYLNKNLGVDNKMESKISKVVEDLLTTIFDEQDIKTGDIAPEQQVRWDNLSKEYAILFKELIEQNKR